MARPKRTLADLKAQREWTFPEFARVLGRSTFYVHDRAQADNPADPCSGGTIHLPVGDVPYIVDRFGSRRQPRRLVLACDYEAVERRRAERLE